MKECVVNKFLRTHQTNIVNDKGRTVSLRGLNLGGWLMMEAYFMHSPNSTPEQMFKQNFAKALGEKALDDFETSFRKIFIQEKDLAWIAKQGFNCLRVPFNFRLIEKEPYKYSEAGFAYLDNVIRWAKKYKIWLILDLHAAPGAQNHDWHSDSLGQAELWTSLENRKRTYAIWEAVAGRYKNEEWVAGYDVLNESVTSDIKTLNRFYHELIPLIRSIDKNHILFIEGNRWSQDLVCLDEFNDDNYALSIHNYEPIQFTFNFTPCLHYPLTKQLKWNRSVIRRHLESYRKISEKRRVPIFVGEFGVNYREGLYGEHLWVRDVIKAFNDYSFHWTYWTYKAVKNSTFPDGVLSYYDNPVWVNRAGPKMGWETYHLHWPQHRREMIDSWDSRNFKVNTKVIEVLKNAN
jgi:endoglucanase